MLAYFPKFHEDELLYSVIARYSVYTRQSGSLLLSRNLFGIDSICPAVDFPIGLTHFASIINPYRQIQVKAIIANHTLFNYYYAFADDNTRKNVLERMTHYVPGVSKPIRRRKSFVNEVRKLRFCPTCRDEMIRDHGEAYWKRSHQLPLVVYCELHEQILVESPFSMASGYKAYNPLNETTPIIEPCQDMRAAADACKSHLVRLGRLSEECLANSNLRSSIARTPSYYRSKLVEKNLARSKKSIDLTALEARSQIYFKDLFEVWPYLRFKKDFSNSALLTPLQIASRKIHSEYHIIIQDFIDQQPEPRVEDNPRDFRALDLQDWPCLNPIALHSAKPKVTITRSKKQGDYNILHFTCECGYAYIRRRYADGRFHRPKLVCFGPTIIPIIKKAEKLRWSLRRIGRELNISHRQVVVEAEKQGIALAPTIRRRIKKIRV